jgi:hypothetical protein
LTLAIAIGVNSAIFALWEWRHPAALTPLRPGGKWVIRLSPHGKARRTMIARWPYNEFSAMR